MARFVRTGNRLPRTWALAATALLMTAACTGEQPAATPAIAGLPDYVVSDRPTLVIDDDGSPERAFSGAVPWRMPDGSIAVADRGNLEIQLFQRDGSYIQRLARRGNGPGELAGDFRLVVHADTLFVMTRPLAPPEVSAFTPTDGFLYRRRVRSADAPTGLTMVDRLDSGQLMIEQGTGFAVLAQAPVAGTLTADSVRYGILRLESDEDASKVAWLPTLRGSWTVAFPWPNGPIPSGTGPHLLGATTAAAASGDRFWMVDAENGDVRAFDEAGTEVVSTRLPLEHQPQNRHVIERVRDRALASVSRAVDSSRIMAGYDPDGMPGAMPLTSEVHAGVDGELWVRLFDVDDSAPQHFLVLDRTGALKGQATLPAGLVVHQIGADFVLGVRRDSLDVESVLEFSLERP